MAQTNFCMECNILQMSEVQVICEMCRQPTLHFFCNACDLRYCSSCGRDHWVRCKSYKVCEKDNQNHALKASRDIQQGEIIFCELPLVVCPKLPLPEGKLPCVGCCRLIPKDNTTSCPACSWPVCSLECPDLNENPHQEECKILKLKRDFSEDKFDFLLLLRILLLQVTNKEDWKDILEKLKDDNDKKEIFDYQEYSQILKIFQNEVLEPLHIYEEENNAAVFENTSNDFLCQILRFLRSNRIEVKDENKNIQIHYPNASWIEHSCCPNTSYEVESSRPYKITIKAISEISKETNMTTSYTNLLKGTYVRRQALKKKNIFCCCSRCKDPTEFNTYFSALICLGSEAEVCRGVQLPKDPTDDSTLWVCDRCQIELPNKQMVKFLEHLGKEVSRVLERRCICEELESLSDKLSMFLHPNHFYLYTVKSRLVQLYKDNEDISINKKIALYESLLETTRKLFRGSCSSHIGRLLHELFDVKFEILKKAGSEVSKKGDFGEVSALIEENQKLTAVLADDDFDRIVAEDVSRFKSLL